MKHLKEKGEFTKSIYDQVTQYAENKLAQVKLISGNNQFENQSDKISNIIKKHDEYRQKINSENISIIKIDLSDPKNSIKRIHNELRKSKANIGKIEKSLMKPFKTSTVEEAIQLIIKIDPIMDAFYENYNVIDNARLFIQQLNSTLDKNEQREVKSIKNSLKKIGAKIDYLTKMTDQIFDHLNSILIF